MEFVKINQERKYRGESISSFSLKISQESLHQKYNFSDIEPSNRGFLLSHYVFDITSQIYRQLRRYHRNGTTFGPFCDTFFENNSVVKLSEKINQEDQFMKPLKLFFLSRLSVVFNRDAGDYEEVPLHQTLLSNPETIFSEGIELQEQSANFDTRTISMQEFDLKTSLYKKRKEHADIDEFHKLCQIFYEILKYLKNAFIAMVSLARFVQISAHAFP